MVANLKKGTWTCFTQLLQNNESTILLGKLIQISNFISKITTWVVLKTWSLTHIIKCKKKYP
jgi:hypothetical protein